MFGGAEAATSGRRSPRPNASRVTPRTVSRNPACGNRGERGEGADAAPHRVPFSDWSGRGPPVLIPAPSPNLMVTRPAGCDCSRSTATARSRHSRLRIPCSGLELKESDCLPSLMPAGRTGRDPRIVSENAVAILIPRPAVPRRARPGPGRARESSESVARRARLVRPSAQTATPSSSQVTMRRW